MRQVTNLNFGQALEALKNGEKIRVPEWKGYWYLSGGKIIVRFENGEETDTPWLKETVLREDWQIVVE